MKLLSWRFVGMVLVRLLWGTAVGLLAALVVLGAEVVVKQM